MKGWISLHRKLRDHWIFKDPAKLKAWLIILFDVNHEQKKVFIHSELIQCDRGQSLNSLDTWRREFGKGWTIAKVRTFFRILESDGMIRTEGLQRTTRLTVINYDHYQSEKSHEKKPESQPVMEKDDTQKTDRSQTEDTQKTTNNNSNNSNNDNKNLKSESNSDDVSNVSKFQKEKEEAFPKFWEFFRHKVGKKKARAAFMRLKRKDFEAIKEHLPNYISNTYVTGKPKPFDGAKLRMNPATYLNGEHWNDDPIERPKDESKIYRRPVNFEEQPIRSRDEFDASHAKEVLQKQNELKAKMTSHLKDKK